MMKHKIPTIEERVAELLDRDKGIELTDWQVARAVRIFSMADVDATDQ